MDLRDGNQALVNPMNTEQKIKLFKDSYKIGFKEIEVGFPSASETEYNILRELIEQKLIPSRMLQFRSLSSAESILLKKPLRLLREQKCNRAFL